MIYSLLRDALERTIRNTDRGMWGNCGRPCTKHHGAGEEDIWLICPQAAGLMS